MIVRWLLVLALALPALAQAATVAVLPLSKATGSDDYDGLGEALAGMLVADLSGVDALTLVERDRLDALLEEIELSESGFVDESTAQRLGRGVGAELVLTGSFSVVQGTFLMDTRLVRVESSEVVKAARADGPVSDFVAVEKDVVEAMLDGLDVSLSSGERRRLLLQTPTESFDALAAYGEGQSRLDQGRIDEARAAFERALMSDPEYAEARAALAGIKLRVAEIRAEDRQRVLTEEERRIQAVLDQTVDERTRPDRHRDSFDDMVRFGLRLYALREQGKHCQRYEELRHYLYRRQGDIDLPPSASRPFVMVKKIAEHAWGMGLVDKEHPGDEYIHDTTINMTTRPVGSLEGLLLDYDDDDPGFYASQSLFHSLSHCRPESEWLPTYKQMRDDLHTWGVADTVTDERNYPGRTIDDQLEVFELILTVRQQGSGPDIERRVQALLDRHEHADQETMYWVTRIAEVVVTEAEHHERHQLVRRGLPEDVLLGMARAARDRDPELLDLDRPLCAGLADQAHDGVVRNLEYLDNKKTKTSSLQYMVDSVAMDLLPMLDMGCFTAVPARFESVDAALSYVADARQRARTDRMEVEQCAEAWERFDPTSAPELMALQTDDAGRARILNMALFGYYRSLVANRCVNRP